jgi:hypothetical protein
LYRFTESANRRWQISGRAWRGAKLAALILELEIDRLLDVSLADNIAVSASSALRLLFIAFDTSFLAGDAASGSSAIDHNVMTGSPGSKTRNNVAKVEGSNFCYMNERSM